MILLKQKLKLRSPIEHVYACCTDISYFQSELVRQAKDEDIKVKVRIRYKDKPFEEGTEIIFLSKTPVLKVVILRNIKNKLIKSSIIPHKFFTNIIGEAVADVRFSTDNSITVIDYVVESVKQPGLLWRIFIKTMILIMLISSRKDIKRFINHVESTT